MAVESIILTIALTSIKSMTIDQRDGIYRVLIIYRNVSLVSLAHFMTFNMF